MASVARVKVTRGYGGGYAGGKEASEIMVVVMKRRQRVFISKDIVGLLFLLFLQLHVSFPRFCHVKETS